MSNRYNKSCCGDSNNTKSFDGNCCEDSPQKTPKPCCNTTREKLVPSNCFRPCSDVTTTDGEFTVVFSNASADDIPSKLEDLVLYHGAAGYMDIISVDGRTFTLSLNDPENAGTILRAGECVAFDIKPSSTFVPQTSNRCLRGIFTVPKVSESETIYIYNGGDISEGSTLTFTYKGQVGSYYVDSYVSNDGLLYAYTVTNAGNGHTVGTTIDGCDNELCAIPIEVINTIDPCPSESNILDTVNGCRNGTPYSMAPDAEGQIITSQLSSDGDSLEWVKQRSTDINCCFFIEGCVKFSASDGCFGTGSGIVSEVPTCFTDAYEYAKGNDQTLPILLNGDRFIVTDVNNVTVDGAAVTEITFSPVPGSIDFGELSTATYDNPEVCLGECCFSCGLGPQVTDHNQLAATDPELERSVYNIKVDPSLLQYQPGQMNHYLIGFAPGATDFTNATVLELDANYQIPIGGSYTGAGKPEVIDPLIFRQKVCNTSDNGCEQLVKYKFNYELFFHFVPRGVRVSYELKHFTQDSTTLEDGSTLNPNNLISAQVPHADYIEGPTIDVFNILGGTSLGFSNINQPKIDPYKAHTFEDRAFIPKCGCGLSIVWFRVSVYGYDVATSGAFGAEMNIRRIIEKVDKNVIDTPELNNSDTFKNNGLVR